MRIEQLNKKTKEKVIIELPDDIKEWDTLKCVKTVEGLSWGGFLGIACTGSYKYYKFDKKEGKL